MGSWACEPLAVDAGLCAEAFALEVPEEERFKKEVVVGAQKGRAMQQCACTAIHAPKRTASPRARCFPRPANTLAIKDAEATLFPIQQQRTPVEIGETRVEIVVHETGVPGLTYAHMHDDENTAVAATLGTLRRRGGRLVEVRHTGERNLSFRLGTTVHTFDPNRVFTEAGAEATLRDLGPYSEAARKNVRAFAEAFLAAIGLETLREGPGLLVTVHNNKAGFYSARSYDHGGEHEREAVRVRSGRETAPDDFFFVTEPRHYNLLQEGPYHVVLQDNAAATDDGSLSVWAASEELPYVNVEAQHGHLREQIDMLAFLNERLATADRKAEAAA